MIIVVILIVLFIIVVRNDKKNSDLKHINRIRTNRKLRKNVRRREFPNDYTDRM